MKSARERLSNRRVLAPIMAVMLGIVGVVAFTANASAGAPKVAPHAPAAVVVVSPSNLNGWITRTDTISGNATSAVNFVFGPSTPPLGVGSVQFTIGSNGFSQAEVRTDRYNGTRLADLTALGYDTYVSSSANNSQAPFFVLNINFGTGTALDDQLVFEPVYQTGTYPTQPAGQPVPNQCPGIPTCVRTGTWQHWDVRLGGVYSSFTNNGPPLFTMAYYISQHPNARIVGTENGGGVRVVAGTGGDASVGFNGNTDNVMVGVNGTSTTFDFEPSGGTMTATASASASASTTGTTTGTVSTTGTATTTRTTTGTMTGTTTGTMTGTTTGTTTASTTGTTTGTVSTTRTTTGTVSTTGTAVASTTASRTATASTTASASATTDGGRVEVCHRTGSQRNPYVRIQISRSALPAHLRHGDIYPVPQGGCPGPGTPTPVISVTPEPTETEVACNVQFSDVPQGSTFYQFIRCLACKDVLGGFPDGTYRPSDNISRGQLSKIVSNSAGFLDDVSGRQTFPDVQPGDTFYVFIERLALKGVIGGFPDGYFRADRPATRGQFSKIVANTGLFLEQVSTQSFSDVRSGDPYYLFVERLKNREVLGGYSDGTFRPNALTSRGQAAKIVSNSFFVGCNPPSASGR